MQIVDTIRYEYPWVFRSLMTVTAVFLISTIFMLIPEGPLTRAIGIAEVQNRVSAVANGTYWSLRAAIHSDGSADYQKLYGSLVGLNDDKQLVASIPTGDQFEQQTFHLANSEIVDVYRAVQTLGALSQETVRFDVYGAQDAVVWVRGIPLNIRLIESGIASPAPKPPSNIFDRAFAAYYWRIAMAR